MDRQRASPKGDLVQGVKALRLTSLYACLYAYLVGGVALSALWLLLPVKRRWVALNDLLAVDGGDNGWLAEMMSVPAFPASRLSRSQHLHLLLRLHCS